MRNARKTGLQVMADLRPVANFLGTVDALASLEDQEAYVDSVLNTAINEADEYFNELAAAAAMSGTNIKHMYEWGTVGINDGMTNSVQDPSSKRARLWSIIKTGYADKKVLSFQFEPSLAHVPKPTEETGMSTEDISRLKTHVFQWKALVLETGKAVTIARKQGTKRLLIPYYENSGSFFSEYDKRRGFALRLGPFTHSPGDTAGITGNFLTFWSQYWEGIGEEAVTASVGKQINADFNRAFVPKKTFGFKPTYPGSLKKMMAVEKGRVTKMNLATARAREAGSEVDE